MVVYGWKKDRFNPKAAYHIGKIPLEELPSIVDLTSFLPPVRNQGSRGSCTGFGWSALLASTVAHMNVFTEIYSPNWIYNGARFLEGTLNSDSGAYPDDCGRWLESKGCLYERFWLYDDHKYLTTNPNDYSCYAIKYNDFQAIRVDNGIDGIMSALADGHCVALGAPWFNAWERPNSDGVLLEINKESCVVGGHQTLIYGYDKSKGIVNIQNSWGMAWANNGRCTMPMNSFERFKEYFGGYDAHYIDFDTTTPIPPIPEPVPTPSKCKIGRGFAKMLNVPMFLTGRNGRFYYMNPNPK